MAGNLLDQCLVQLEHLLVIIQQENFILGRHGRGEG